MPVVRGEGENGEKVGRPLFEGDAIGMQKGDGIREGGCRSCGVQRMWKLVSAKLERRRGRRRLPVNSLMGAETCLACSFGRDAKRP